MIWSQKFKRLYQLDCLKTDLIHDLMKVYLSFFGRRQSRATGFLRSTVIQPVNVDATATGKKIDIETTLQGMMKFLCSFIKKIRKWKTYLQQQAKKNNISISIITSIGNKQFTILFLLLKNVLTKNLIFVRLISKVYLFKYILLCRTIETSLPVSFYHFDFSVNSVCSFSLK